MKKEDVETVYLSFALIRKSYEGHVDKDRECTGCDVRCYLYRLIHFFLNLLGYSIFNI